MASELEPRLDNARIDRLASVLRGTSGLVPFVGSLIAEVVDNIIPEQRVDRIVQFVRLLEIRLEKMEQEALRARIVQAASVDLLEDGFVQAVRAVTQERLEHIANVVAEGFSAAEFDQAEAKRMLWLLGQLNDSEIVLLRGAIVMTKEDHERDREYRQTHERLLAPDMIHLSSSLDEREDAALKGSYRQHLHDLGLLRHRFSSPRSGQLPEFDTRTGMMKSSGTGITLLGRMLLRYLNLIPAWYRR